MAAQAISQTQSLAHNKMEAYKKQLNAVQYNLNKTITTHHDLSDEKKCFQGGHVISMMVIK